MIALSPQAHHDMAVAVYTLMGAYGTKAILRGLAALPGVAVEVVKNRFRAAQAAGRIDRPTARMLTAVWKALFAWADAEIPDAPDEDKINEVVTRLSVLPIIGPIVKLNPALAHDFIEEEFIAIKTEVKAQDVPASGSTGS